jgi:hypothetical protein
MYMHTVTLALLLVFVVLAAVDGLYLHLWKLRLHARLQSWREHLWHTGTALLFAPVLATIFLAPTGGWVLWTGIGFLVLTHAVEVLDVRAEQASRADLGGVSRGELATHVVLFVARSAAIALSLAARPAEAWALDAPANLHAISPPVALLIPGALAVGALHAWLAWRHRPCCTSVPA